MHWFLPAVVLLVPGVLGGTSTPAGALSVGVDVIKVDGAIDSPMRDYLVGSIEQAESDGGAVLLQLDSPGTLGIDPFALADRIHSARVPILVWIGPSGARAAGGATFLLAAAALAVASPGVGIGPATPPNLADPTAPIDDGRFVSWLEEALELLPDRPVPAQGALDLGAIDVAAPELTSLNDVLERVDDLVVFVSGSPVSLDTWDDSRAVPQLVRLHDLGPGRRVLHAVASPASIYVLLSLGLALIAFELTQAGVGVAGVSGVAMVALAGYGLAVVPPFWPGMALLVVGIGAMIVDVKLRRLGPLSVGGLLAFALGSILAYGRVADAIDLSPWLIGGVVVGSTLYYLFGLTVAVQSRERMTSSRRGLVGLIGEARGELAPEGPVMVKGSLWRGRAMDGPIPPGTRILVRSVEGLVLRVEPTPGANGPDAPDVPEPSA